MDRHLRERLEKALHSSASSGGSDPAGFDDTELRGYGDLVNSLRADAAGLAGPVSSDFGRAQMLSNLRSQDGTNGGVRRMIFSQPLVIKVAGAVAGTALVFVGMAGASAATGGPNVADDVFNAAGIGDTDDDANDDVDEEVNDDADEDVNDDADEDTGDDADDDADIEDDADEADDADEDAADDADEADDDADDADEIAEVDDSPDDGADDGADDSSDDAADDSSDDDVEDGGTDGG